MSKTGITNVADGTWIKRGGPIHWKIVIDYTTLGRENVFEYAIVDLPWFINGDSVGQELHQSYLGFLTQFETVALRWGNYYEEFTEDIISCAAVYQKTLIQNKRGGLCEDDTEILVLLALRCLAISHDLSVVDWNPVNLEREYKRQNEAKFEPITFGRASGSHRLRPLIELWPMSQDYERPNSGKDYTNSLSFLLRKTFRTAQRLLLRGQPQDWPTLFYTIALLKLTHEKFHHLSFGSCGRELEEALKSLIRLYLHFCGYFHPLNAGLDIEWCSLMVGGDALRVKHYKEMNSMWIERRMFSEAPDALSHELMKSPGDETQVVENVKTFYVYLDFFCSGFM
jgi:hypothetical protein